MGSHGQGRWIDGRIDALRFQRQIGARFGLGWILVQREVVVRKADHERCCVVRVPQIRPWTGEISDVEPCGHLDTWLLREHGYERPVVTGKRGVGRLEMELDVMLHVECLPAHYRLGFLS